MGRAPREFVAGGVYHVFARGSNRQPIFEVESDRADFLLCAERTFRRMRARCLAYCLMTNHYHLVLETEDGEVSRLMQGLNSSYALRFNHRYGRVAHLFKNRFGAVDQRTTSQLLWTLRYVVQNPVGKGLCGAPEEWRWSSYRASVGLDRAPGFLDVPRLLSYFGDPPPRAGVLYRDFVADRISV
jgi:REP element-mobilizing transposase RayT